MIRIFYGAELSQVKHEEYDATCPGCKKPTRTKYEAKRNLYCKSCWARSYERSSGPRSYDRSSSLKE